jgi:hypothetical protein
MDHGIKTFKEVSVLLPRVWKEAGKFFNSIEVALMLLMAVSTVAGVWLAFTADLRCLLFFGLVIGYFTARPILHVKGILRWPFFG